MAESQDNKKVSGTTDMTQGSPWKHIVFFTLPLLAGNLFQQLYYLVDTIIVGQGVGGSGLAGVGTTTPAILLITSFFVGIGLGAMVLLSQYYSIGDLETLRKMVATVYSLLLPLIGIVTLISLPLTGPMLQLIKVPDGVTFEMARIYMVIIILGFLGSFGFNLNAGLLQAMGNSLVPFVMLFISTLLNIGLDLLFVLVFQWGVAGAAIATVIAQTFSWVGSVLYINRHYPFLHLTLFKSEIHKDLLKKAVRLGLPSGLNQSLFSAGMLVMQGLVNAQGENFMGGFAAANKIDTFAFLPIQSVATAVTTFVAQNMGVSAIDRAKKGLKIGLILSCLVGVAVAVIILPLGPFFMRLFIADSDPRVVESVISSGMAYLRDVLPFFSVLAVLFMLNAMLRGAGQTLVPMLATLLGLWVVRVPVAYWLTAAFGADSMYYSYVIGWATAILISGLYYLSGKWKNRHLVDPNMVTMLG